MSIDFLGFVVVSCYIFFETDAFIEYSRLLKLKFTKYHQYNQFKTQGFLPYHQFLLASYNNFFTRLITCPICLIVWFCLVGKIFYNFNLFWEIILCWIGYFGIRKLLKILE